MPSATAAQAAPAQIKRLEAIDRDPGVEIDVVADRALVWTTYRDRDGNLVIELPNTVPGPELGDLSRTRGLIRAIEIERLEDAERPLTRLVVRTREDSEHALTTSGTTLRLELYPAGFAPPVEVARETPPESSPAPTPVVKPAMGTEAPAVGDYSVPERRVVGPPVTGVAASRLIRVEVMGADEGTAIRIVGDGEFAYTTFRLENPDRFVLDLSGVINTSLRSTVTVGGDVVDQVRIGQFKPRPEAVSRVVFDLRRFAVPHIDRGPDGLMIRFVEMPAPTRTAEAAPEPAAPEPVAPEPIEEDLAEAETVVAETLPEQPILEEALPPVVAAPPPAPPVEVLPPMTEEPEPPVVAAAPEPAAPEPVVPEPVAPEPFVIEPVEEAEEVPVVVVEVTPEVAAPPVLPPPTPPPPVRPPPAPTDVARLEAQQIAVEPASAPTQQTRVPPSFQSLVVSSQQRTYVGDPISMSLKNADLVETLRSFSRISDLNFVIQPGVQGSVTVELDGVPWDQALEQILKIHELGMDIDGTIVRIAKLADLRREAEERRQLALIRQQTVPMRTVMRSLSYARAEEIAQLLQARGGATGGRRGQSSSGILSSRGTVQVDERTNTLIIRELPEVIDTVLAVISNLDTPEPQVKIEARIVEATKSFSRSLGIRWNFTGVASNEFGNSTGIEFPNNINADGGVNLLTGGDQGFLNLSLGNVLNTFTLDASLIAAENEGLINVVSAPSIMTLNNELAVIQSGIQIPIQTVANDTVTVQFVNATLQLSVEPQVTAEGTILMQINVTKKEPQPALLVVGATNAPIATREAQTRVIVRDGGTAVIGGIYEVSNNQSQDRVPGLANVPILKHLFRNRSRENRNQELLIFVTPRIIRM